MLRFVRLFICMSVCLSHAPSSKTVHYRAIGTRTLIGTAMLQVEPTVQRGNGRNGNEAVADAAPESFAIIDRAEQSVSYSVVYVCLVCACVCVC